MQWAIDVAGLRKTFTTSGPLRPGLRNALHQLVRPASHTLAAVKDISFQIASGERVAFIGHNGAGKSTTLKMLTGILHPTSGHATVHGLVPWRDRRRLAYHIGAVFGQRSQLFYHLPATASFDLLAEVYGQDRRQHTQRRDALIDIFELGSFLPVPVHKLSLGQRMRCEVAASLLHAPDVLFLDEPTIGLDVVAKAAIRDVLRTHAEQDGRTVVLTSHDPGDMERVCERVIIIHEGQILRDQSLAALRRSYMHRKRVLVHSASPEINFAHSGVDTQRTAPHRYELEVDTNIVPLGEVLNRLLTSTQVLDLAISEPPLEDIIAGLYRDAHQQANPNQGARPHASRS